MKPIKFKKLKSTKKSPKRFIMYSPPFRVSGSCVVDSSTCIITQFADNELMKINGEFYDPCEVVATALNMLCEAVVDDKGEGDGE